MAYKISFVIPVYNRPDELQELLESMTIQSEKLFEVVVIEDGSQLSSDDVIARFQPKLDLVYFKKENTGPGDSRNFGMRRAKGDYFIILDSDCVLPPHYVKAIQDYLQVYKPDFFGGSDAAHSSFTNFQKAINFTMTSLLTTGGLRGSSKAIQKFEPRSFNMGISKEAFEKSGGFGLIHPGEDPDMTMRLWRLGYQSSYVKEAFVFHKRRINIKLFSKQVHAFGSVRPILLKRFPEYAKLSFWFPTLFSLGFLTAICMQILVPWLLYVFLCYFAALFLVALFTEGLAVSILVIPCFLIQMFSYGYGFLMSSIRLAWSKKSPEILFPHLFFRKPNGS